MEKSTRQSKQKWQQVVFVVGFVFCNGVGQASLRTQPCLVYKLDPTDPVTLGQLTMTLYIILSAGKVPHEIAQIHITDLVAKEKVHILSETWNANGAVTIVAVSTHAALNRITLLVPPEVVEIRFIHLSPIEILICMPVLVAPHPGEYSFCITIILVFPVLLNLVILLLALVVTGFPIFNGCGP